MQASAQAQQRTTESAAETDNNTAASLQQPLHTTASVHGHESARPNAPHTPGASSFAPMSDTCEDALPPVKAAGDSDQGQAPAGDSNQGQTPAEDSTQGQTSVGAEVDEQQHVALTRGVDAYAADEQEDEQAGDWQAGDSSEADSDASAGPQDIADQMAGLGHVIHESYMEHYSEADKAREHEMRVARLGAQAAAGLAAAEARIGEERAQAQAALRTLNRQHSVGGVSSKLLCRTGLLKHQARVKKMSAKR